VLETSIDNAVRSTCSRGSTITAAEIFSLEVGIHVVAITSCPENCTSISDLIEIASLPKSDPSAGEFRTPSLIGSPGCNSKARVTNRRRWLANSESADLKPASLTRGPIGVVLITPIIERACLFTNF
jgi:hypothetical protein